MDMGDSLRDLVNYFEGAPKFRDSMLFSGFFKVILNLSADPFCWMYSGGEEKIDKLIRKNSAKFIQYTIKHAVRVYPDISRVCSSNYIPMVSCNY